MELTKIKTANETIWRATRMRYGEYPCDPTTKLNLLALGDEFDINNKGAPSGDELDDAIDRALEGEEQSESARPAGKRRVLVLNEDPLEVLRECRRLRCPTLLVFSTQRESPFTNLEQGVRGIEYDVYRSSNYCLGVGENAYPLDQGSALHNKAITFFKNSKGKLLDAPFKAGTLAMGAELRPAIMQVAQSNGKYGTIYAHAEVPRLLLQKIKGALRLAEINRYQAVVLTDVGEFAWHPLEELAARLRAIHNASAVPYLFYALPTVNLMGERDERLTPYHRLRALLNAES